MKGKGLYFNPRKGYGFIEVLSEIDENVPDRNRLLELLNGETHYNMAGIMCNAVSKRKPKTMNHDMSLCVYFRGIF